MARKKFVLTSDNKLMTESGAVSRKVDELVSLLKRWESAYNGYAIDVLPIKIRMTKTENHSTESIPQLIGATRDAIEKEG